MSYDPSSIETERPSDWADNLHSLYFRTKSYLYRYWWILVITVSVSVGYKAYNNSKKEPTYVSSAQLRFEQPLRLPEASVMQDRYQNMIGNQIETLKSPKISRLAHERVAAMHPELEKSSVNLRVSNKRGTTFFNLVSVGSNKEYTQAYLDALMKSFLEERKKRRDRKAEEAMQSYTVQISYYEKDLQKIENKLLEFKKNNNLVLIQERGSSVGKKLNSLKNELDNARQRKRKTAYLENKVQKHEKMSTKKLAELDDRLFSVDLFKADENYIQTRKNLNKLLSARNLYAKDLKSKHPKMLEFDREITRLRDRLKIHRDRAISQFYEQEGQIDAKIENLKISIAEAKKEALKYSKLLGTYEKINKQRKRTERLYEKLLNSIQNIDLSSNIQLSSASISRSASVSRIREVRLFEGTTTSILLGLVSGGGLIFLIGGLDRRVISTEDLKREFEEPVLGIIPKDNSFEGSNPRFMKEAGKRHIFSEAFRTLRSSLLFMEHGKQESRCFMVTSAVPEEGKSTIASHLAISLAMASSRTLLVDADLRRGRLNRTFNVPNKNGLVEALRGDVPLDEAIYNTEVENLDFIPKGASASNSAELLLSDKTQEILEILKYNYDYIVFDAAPVLATDDTTSFASKVDSILYVVRSNSIRLRQVRVSVDNLKLRGANISGFIINFADTRGMDYYYYNKYQYYYRYHTNEIT